MRSVRSFISFTVLLLLVHLAVLAHDRVSEKRSVKEPCLRYHFQAGDSVVYRLTAIDTIQFVGAPWLVKERDELISVVCDYVDPHGRMFLRQDQLSSRSSEVQQGDTTHVIRTTNPWKGHTAYIILDSNGRRILSRQLDTIHAAICPGGAFQTPLLLSLLDTTCHRTSDHRGWLMEHTDTLVENGFPYPLISQLFNCSIRDSVYKTQLCFCVEFGQTAQASQKTLSNDLGVYSRSVINTWGTSLFSKAEGQPLLTQSHSDIKLWVNTPQSQRRGEQRTHLRYERIFSKRTH